MFLSGEVPPYFSVYNVCVLIHILTQSWDIRALSVAAVFVNAHVDVDVDIVNRILSLSLIHIQERASTMDNTAFVSLCLVFIIYNESSRLYKVGF